MSKTAHRIYIGIFVLLGVFTFFYLLVTGISYYGTSIEERFFHPEHDSLKPSGAVGHGLGIIGTLFIIIGVSTYMIRKRVKRFRRIGVLKHWLEFHIFLCAVGPTLVLFHTAFKFGGIVSISFWSMVAVVLSGVIGRFIYIQIPRTINGRELTLNEVREMQIGVAQQFRESSELSPESLERLMAVLQPAQEEENPPATAGVGGKSGKTFSARRTIRQLKSVMKAEGLSRPRQKQLLKLANEEISLRNKIDRLQTMRRLFRYWHVAHLPFAIIMMVIMVIHVAVTLAFGYKWIF